MRYLYSSIYLLQEPIIAKMVEVKRTKGGVLLFWASLVQDSSFRVTEPDEDLKPFIIADIWLDGCYALSRLYSKTSPKSGPS